MTALSRERGDELETATLDELDRFVELVELAARFELPLPELDDPLADAVEILRGRGMNEPADALQAAHRGLTAAGGAAAADAEPVGDPGSAVSDPQVQPRFVSESYFLDFPFEPGNYFFAGRETVAGHEVVKIEYYPEQLFSENVPASQRERDEEVNTGFEKTSLVTLWIEPEEYQIVKFTFDTVGFEFWPYRWLVRLDDLKASMVMGQPIEEVWLPEAIELTGKLSLATGSFTVRYTRTFSDYRQADVETTIRSYGPPR